MTTKPEFKIIADHLRSSCFLIADGILPSNEGRGYVLRRIMRRAMRQLHKLGAKEASMYKFVDSLIKEMGSAYPELGRAKAVIVETLKNEEEKFRETLEKGLKILEEEIGKTKTEKFSGATAFKLYDTYGFPLDLTQDILKEKNLIVDLEEFNSEMELQRERARANWKGSGEVAEESIFFDLKEKFGETKFLGYETLSTKAKVLAVYPNFIILDQTPFYATSGGQKGDDGKIGDIEISETKKFAGGLFVHFIANRHPERSEGSNNSNCHPERSEGSQEFVSQDSSSSPQNNKIKIGDEVEAIVNSKTRKARAANHSATHLMHKALKTVLGNSISQKGSNVDADYFTFDFNFNRAMTVEEIAKVEQMVNEQIKKSAYSSTKLMNIEDAKNSGAEALFGEKYDAEVRVVAIANSIELCGGTHVQNTSEIEIFKIISEKSVASGIRRIEAASANSAKEYLAKQAEKSQNLISDLKEKISKKDQEISELDGSKSDDSYLQEHDAKTLEEILKKKEKEVERLKKQILLANLNNLKSEKISNLNLVSHIFDDVEAKDLRDILNEIKTKKEFSNSCIFAFFSNKDGKVAACISVSSDLLEKFDSSKLITPIIEAIGGKGGGGKKDFAMGGGTNKEGIPQAIEILKNLIK
jgi:alanyl-tRNA synthetase